MLGLRFEEDSISPAERMHAIATALCGEKQSQCARFEPVVVPGKGHATLTVGYAHAKKRGRDTRDIVRKFLQANLTDKPAATGA